MKNLVQVAGIIIDEAEADMLAAEGMDWLGLPFRLASGKHDITESDAAGIIGELPPPQAGVLISYMTDADEMSEFCDQLGVSAVQLHGDVDSAQLRKLKTDRPDLDVLKSLVVRDNIIDELLAIVDGAAQYMDMFVTDTENPATGSTGATGLLHDWSISAELVRRSPKPLMMAGGPAPEEVAGAIQPAKPAAVSARTGLEGADGRKDQDKVQRFVSNARRAFAEVNT